MLINYIEYGLQVIICESQQSDHHDLIAGWHTDNTKNLHHIQPFFIACLKPRNSLIHFDKLLPFMRTLLEPNETSFQLVSNCVPLT